MKKILGVALVSVLALALATPVSAGGFHGGGGRGGGRGGFHHGGFHHGGFTRFGCCFGPGFVGGVFVGSALAYPYYAYPYAYPYAAYPAYSDPVYAAPVDQPQTQVSVAPSAQRQVCYPSGCYYLYGDGVTVAYSWKWVPAVLAAPPAPTGPPDR